MQACGGRSSCDAAHGRRGFSLIEVLLVVLIVSILVATTTPSMVNAIKGNRLRAGTRSIVQSVRYARNMAILNQQPYEIRYDLDGATITVGPAGGMAPPANSGPEPTPLNSASLYDEALASDAEAPEVQPAASAGDEITRELERLRITDVDARSQTAGTVRFQRNGRCTAHEVRLEDESGAYSVISVDALGDVYTETHGL